MDISISSSKDSHKSESKHQYKQELYRGLNSFMSFSLCFSNVAVVSSLALLIQFGFMTGGPVVMLYGWIVVSIFSLIVAASMAEICSTYPMAGSVYYWAGALASQEWSPLASYLCGFLNFFGNVANNSAFAFGLAQVFAGIRSLNGDHAWPVQFQVFISICIIAVWAVKNRMRIDHQGWFNNTSALY